jgi:phosphatidylglycerophosphatase A
MVLGTWLGVGRLPVMPGIWGSLVALPVPGLSAPWTRRSAHLTGQGFQKAKIRKSKQSGLGIMLDDLLTSLYVVLVFLVALMIGGAIGVRN